MKSRELPDLERLATIRPPLASRTTQVASIGERERLCEQIMLTSPTDPEAAAPARSANRTAPAYASSAPALTAGSGRARTRQALPPAGGPPRPRRTLVLTGGTALTAAAVAAGLVIASNPGSSGRSGHSTSSVALRAPTRQPPAHTSTTKPTPDMDSVAYVTSQVISAMNAPNDSVFETLTTNQSANTATNTNIQDWQYPLTPQPGQQLQLATTTTSPRSGQLETGFFGVFTVISGEQGCPARARVSTFIYYAMRLWETQPDICDPEFAVGPTSPIILPSTDNQGISLRIPAELREGDWRIAGHPTVDGRPTIELEWQRPGISAQLWVSPSTYLPVKFVESAPIEKGGFLPPHFTETSTYRYLAPTAANLAHLHLSIPTGFTHFIPGSSPKSPK